MASPAEILVGMGAVSIVAAIIGGGLEGSGVRVPVIGSLRRQIGLGIVGAMFLAIGIVLEWDPRPDPWPKPTPTVSPTISPSELPTLDPPRVPVTKTMNLEEGRSDLWRNLRVIAGNVWSRGGVTAEIIFEDGETNLGAIPLHQGDTTRLDRIVVDGCGPVSFSIGKIEVRRLDGVSEADWINSNFEGHKNQTAGTVEVKMSAMCHSPD